MLVSVLFSLFLNIMRGNQEAFHMLLGVRKCLVRKCLLHFVAQSVLEDSHGTPCDSDTHKEKLHFFPTSEGEMIPEMVPLNVSLGGKQARQWTVLCKGIPSQTLIPTSQTHKLRGT